MSGDLWIERDLIAGVRGRLFGYFARDAERRFIMENAIGGGVAALTWKIQYMERPGQPQYIVLKTDRIYSRPSTAVGPDYESSLILERQNLEILRWAKHTVKEVQVARDPLLQTVEGLQSHYMQMGHWLYLEWLENGTVKSMVKKASFNRIRLPNRFLWRIFLCLIRMCIAMGWPPTQPPGPNPQPVSERARGGATAGFQHRDMHTANIMFGSLRPNDPDREHSEVPILKLIDFGSMLDFSANDRRLSDVSVAENLFDVGRVMVELITLDKDISGEIGPSLSDALPFRVAANTPEALTNGVHLLPDEDGVDPFPDLDNDLRGLICACLAPEPAGRPRAGPLANAVLTAVNGRDATFYGASGVEGETDADLRGVIGRLFFDAF